ncbi:DeoR family transcriptional regulator [Herbiconiux sp. UC225_62]|uniref:DeoR family transcriptional regulator n=1 Tax=Herbiconiux sp. UC225_62 TaxID=3350168 RepID=UPI0036D2F8C0
MALKGTLDGETRRAALLELTDERGSLQLSEAAELWGVHPMTIRRDFELLESSGRVRRVRGGIVPVQIDAFGTRQGRNLRAKERIAAKILPSCPRAARWASTPPRRPTCSPTPCPRPAASPS